MKAIIIAAIMGAFLSPAAHAQTKTAQPMVNGYHVIPAQPGTTVQPFGRGALVKPQGQGQPTQVQPFGRGLIVQQPGKPAIQCVPLGRSMSCR